MSESLLSASPSGPAREPAAFDAVLFDLDGTLVQSFEAWVPALRRAYALAGDEVGRKLRLPSLSDLTRTIGVDAERGLRDASPELSAADLGVLLRHFRSERDALVMHRGMAWMPGAREAAKAFREGGARLGIASYCGRSTLDSCMVEMGLGELFESGRSADSAGCANKGDMLADLLLEFGTRSAVMVGDRHGDIEAAHAVGLPAVHFRGGFAPASEGARAEASVEDLAELPALLARRTRSLDAVLDRLQAALPGGGVVALVGALGAGSEPLAAGLAARATWRGCAVRAEAAFEADALLEAARAGSGGVGSAFAGSGPAASGPAASEGVQQLAQDRSQNWAPRAGELLFLYGPGAGLVRPQQGLELAVEAPAMLRQRRLRAFEARLEGPEHVAALLAAEASGDVGPEQPERPWLVLDGARPLEPYAV